MKKFTLLDSELIRENAELALKFSSNYKDALQKLDDIKIELDNFAINQVKEPTNWGYVGSIAHVDEELDDILEFLGVKEIKDDSGKYNL